jgi:hypothetical protein
MRQRHRRCHHSGGNEASHAVDSASKPALMMAAGAERNVHPDVSFLFMQPSVLLQMETE